MADLRRNGKRKLEEDDDYAAVVSDVIRLVSEANPEADDITRCLRRVSRLAKSEDKHVDLFFHFQAFPALLTLLEKEHHLQNLGLGACIIGRLANKPEHQDLLAKDGSLRFIVNLLERHHSLNTPHAYEVLCQAAYAITRLVHQHDRNKAIASVEGAIPFLVGLLKPTNDETVLKAATKALYTLALNNDAIKTQIVDCQALPNLVLLLWSDNYSICHEAVGLVNTLARGSSQIKTQVCDAGALHPVIQLLSSTCPKTQIQAALLIGRLAANSYRKAHIVQRGALGPLVQMLQSENEKFKELSSYALGRLAQDPLAHIQVGIAHAGGIAPLVEQLDSSNDTLKHHAAYALYGLASSEDIVAELIVAGAFENLLEGHFSNEDIVHSTASYVAKTVKRLEERFHVERVLNRLLSLMQKSDKTSQSQILLALAFLCSSDDQKRVFVDNNGIDLLMELLENADSNLRGYASAAFCRLAEKATTFSPVGAEPSSPISMEINADNLEQLYNLSCDLSAVSLRNACCLFALTNFQELNSKAWYRTLLVKMLPSIKDYFVEMLVET